jgi:uncharacterized RDD family membrane protein YckC
MEYEDTRTIATPEGVELALPLAGLGSRFMALMLDLIVQYLLLGAAVAFFSFVLGGTVGAIALSIAGLVILVGYDVLFEVLGGGRTLGKRASGLRVVLDTGAPVALRASLVRNLIRLLEGFATLYVPAMISVLASRDNQRLGDHAAGTLVIRDPRGGPPLPDAEPRIDPGAYVTWDVTGVSDDDVAAVRSFLARRSELDGDAREQLADDLARQLRGRVAGAPAGLSDEGFLERLAAVKTARR